MKAGAYLDDVEAALRRTLTAEELRQVEVLRDRAIGREEKDRILADSVGRDLQGLLLVAFMPLIRRFFHERLRRWRDWDDLAQSIVGEFVEVVATYPLERRPAGIASNIALDLLNRLCDLDRACRQTKPLPDDLAADPVAADLMLDLSTALRAGRIGELDFELLVGQALYDRGADELASRHGLSPVAVRKRLQRARDNLQTFFKTDVTFSA